MSLRVLDPGLYTLVVDRGRLHHRSLGVPVGGAADRTALALGNALVGNPPEAAALEFSLAGPTLEASCELACVVYGAPFQLVSNRQKLTAGKTFTLSPGEVLQVLGTHKGVRGYLCVRGGIQTQPVLGSRSSLGPLQAGADIPCLTGRIRPHFFRWEKRCTDGIRELRGEQPGAIKRLHVLTAPQSDWVTLEGFFFGDGASTPLFEVTPASNRMGLRLAGPALNIAERELVSEPVCPGAVQLTRDGQCIILGMDGQTIGGYPKIAQVISADLDTVGQLRPGTRIYFVRTTLEHAEKLFRETQAEVAALVTRLRAACG